MCRKLQIIMEIKWKIVTPTQRLLKSRRYDLWFQPIKCKKKKKKKHISDIFFAFFLLVRCQWKKWSLRRNRLLKLWGPRKWYWTSTAKSESSCCRWSARTSWDSRLQSDSVIHICPCFFSPGWPKRKERRPRNRWQLWLRLTVNFPSTARIRPQLWRRFVRLLSVCHIN